MPVCCLWALAGPTPALPEASPRAGASQSLGQNDDASVAPVTSWFLGRLSLDRPGVAVSLLHVPPANSPGPSLQHSGGCVRRGSTGSWGLMTPRLRGGSSGRIPTSSPSRPRHIFQVDVWWGGVEGLILPFLAGEPHLRLWSLSYSNVLPRHLGAQDPSSLHKARPKPGNKGISRCYLPASPTPQWPEARTA